jgi:hypothetical protein
MLAMDEASTDVYGRTEEPVDPDGLETDRRTDDVHNGVHRTYFVKLHILRRHLVNLPFRNGQFLEYLDRPFPDRSRQTAPSDHIHDLGGPTMGMSLVPMRMGIVMVVLVTVIV